MKVGVFDSGLGGLTVFKSIIQYVPQLDYIYLGDSKRAPYGNRSFQEILSLSQEAVSYLFKANCQVIIIACNTASAKALKYLQEVYLPNYYPNRRILGVVRPATEHLLNRKNLRHLAIWGTRGTIDSKSYEIELKDSNILITPQICHNLADLIEQNNKRAILQEIEKYWSQTLQKNPKVEVIFLACTHYPLIKDDIQLVVGKQIEVLDQVDIVGRRWQWYLNHHPEIYKMLSLNQTKTFLSTNASLTNEMFSKIMSSDIQVQGINLSKSM